MWYSVEILFRCDVHGKIDEPPDEVLYDRAIFLVNVLDEQQLSEKIESISRARETRYKNSDGDDVEWRFVKVLTTQKFIEEELHDGMEVFSQLVWQPEIEDLLND